MVMLNILSILVGIVALIGAIIGLVPLLGWANWLVLPVVAVGILLGLLSDRRSGLYFCLVVFVISGLRLFLGGGLI